MYSFLEDHAIGKTMVGVLLLAVGLACLAFLVANLAQDLSIWVLGRRTTGEVVDLVVEQTNEAAEGELTFRYFVTYRFTTRSGQVITKTSSAAVNEWSNLQEGDPVAVVYFPLYPAHNRLSESRYIPVLACAYLPLAVLGWIGLQVGWYLVRPVFASRRRPGKESGRAP